MYDGRSRFFFNEKQLFYVLKSPNPDLLEFKILYHYLSNNFTTMFQCQRRFVHVFSTFNLHVVEH